MNFKSVFVVIFLFFFLFDHAGAEERVVKGKVTTFHKIPLNKVSLILKNAQKEFLSDSTGCFEFNCDAKEKITVKANGFFPEKIKISDIAEQDSLHVDLRFKNGEKNFKVATGYGHISEKQLNYAIAHLESGPDYSSYGNILEIIEGRISGVSVRSDMINIRGTTTLNEGPIPALLVVDGTIVQFSVFVNIPPDQVKSIDILKGAAASARYGSRGMGGVVIVKTKTKN